MKYEYFNNFTFLGTIKDFTVSQNGMVVILCTVFTPKHLVAPTNRFYWEMLSFTRFYNICTV